MNNKIIVSFIVVALILVAGVFWYVSSDSNQESTINLSDSKSVTNDADLGTIESPSPEAVEEKVPEALDKAPYPTPGDEITGTFSSGEEIDAPDISVFEISYDGKKYTPEKVNLKVGDVVFFKNDSNKTFWPASDPHPAHTSV
jgi:hypothetical protein